MTAEGIGDVFAVVDAARAAFKVAGVCRLGKLVDAVTGDSFRALAAVDMAIEVGQLAVVHDAPVTQDKVIVPGLTATQAERRAGKMRDAMTDMQCAEGWNYLAVRVRPGMNVRTGLKAPGVPR